jgi:hypothetical protein
MLAAYQTSLDLYHPVHNGNTPTEALIVAAVLIAFVLVMIAAASIGRPRGEPAEDQTADPPAPSNPSGS